MYNPFFSQLKISHWFFMMKERVKKSPDSSDWCLEWEMIVLGDMCASSHESKSKIKEFIPNHQSFLGRTRREVDGRKKRLIIMLACI